MSAQLRLHEFVAQVLGLPFVWGETNCVSLALRATDAQYGTELHPRYRKFMSSAVRASIFCRNEGLDGIIRRVEAVKMLPIRKNFEREGDVLFIATKETIGAAVILGRQCLSSTDTDGVRLYDRREIQSSIILGIR